MLRGLIGLKGFRLRTSDEDVGQVEDFYFDDSTWKIRYLVADTGTWVQGKKVLISPAGFYGKPDWTNKTFPVVFFTKEMIEEQPDADSIKPKSQKIKELLPDYSHWAEWSFEHPDQPPFIGLSSEIDEALNKIQQIKNTHLRSVSEVSGYHIKSKNKDIGKIVDFIVDDELWIIRFLAISTKNLFPSRKFLIIPLWVQKINWETRNVLINLSSEEVDKSPSYDPETPINKEKEKILFDYYGRPKRLIE